ncbi:MAG: hypothetical protein KJO35_09370, partial [Gammaproteobacteria bacterium]|nr:hypothetical protein [Gammaproteobacteria bacterium]
TIPVLDVSATLIITAVVNSTGPYDLTAEVTSVDEPDPDSTPNNGIAAEDDQASTTTSPRLVTDMLLDMSVDDPIPAPGGTVVLTVVLENHGPYNATGIVISLPPLPGDLSYDSATPGVGNFNLASGTWDGFDLDWSGDPLLPFTATLTVTASVAATVAESTILEINGQLDFDQLDPDIVEEDAIVLLVLDDGLDHDWVGGAGPDPTDWHNANNWSGGLVPSPGDNVTIDPTGFDPVLSADVLTLATLNIEAGAQVFANGYTISTVGALDARDGPVTGPGLVRLEFGKLRGSVPDLEVQVASASAEVEFSGDVMISGDLTISQGRLDTKFRTTTVSGNLLSTGSGIMLQKEGGSEVIVAGDVTFEGADYSKKIDGKFPLRDGELYVGGNFMQIGHPHSFAAERSHLVVFNGGGSQTVYFQDPDNSNPGTDLGASTGSRFANLRVDKDAAVDGELILLSDIVVLRTLEQPLVGVPEVQAAPGSGHVLMIGGADLDTPIFPLTDNIVFRNVPVEIFEGDDISHLEGVVFRDMDPQVIQLLIERVEFGANKELIDIEFETLPNYAAGGRYLVVNNLHPDPTKNLTLDVLQSLPAYGEPMTEAIGNTNINWGIGNEDSDRDGITDADEYTNGTNPVFADSDSDGLSDPDELAEGTDPVNSDTDGDGISDGAELSAGADPLVAAAPGTVLYVRPSPLGNDANSGFGGWGDALASNTAVEAALTDGMGPGQPFIVLYDAGVYAPLEIDSFSDISLVGSMGPGIDTPLTMPTTIFDAGSTPDVAVIRVIDSTSINIQSMLLPGASNSGGGDGSLGGGVYVNYSSSATISRVSIEDNIAADAGGGLYVEAGGSVEVNDSVIRRNLVPVGGIGGGGIAALGGLSVNRSIVADNRYEGNASGGGGFYIEAISGAVSLRDNIVLSNYSSESGG